MRKYSRKALQVLKMKRVGSVWGLCVWVCVCVGVSHKSKTQHVLTADESCSGCWSFAQGAPRSWASLITVFLFYYKILTWVIFIPVTDADWLPRLFARPVVSAGRHFAPSSSIHGVQIWWLLRPREKKTQLRRGHHDRQQPNHNIKRHKAQHAFKTAYLSRSQLSKRLTLQFY